MDYLSKVKTLLHFVFYHHTNASWPFLLNGAVILFLFADQLQFTMDVFQDL